MNDNFAQMYLQLSLRQWEAANVYILVLSSWKVNIAENPIAIMEVVDTLSFIQYIEWNVALKLLWFAHR